MTNIPMDLGNWYQKTNLWLVRWSLDQKITLINSIKESCKRIIFNHWNNDTPSVQTVVETETQKIKILDELLDWLVQK